MLWLHVFDCIADSLTDSETVSDSVSDCHYPESGDDADGL